MTNPKIISIPRPLVRVNQWIILLCAISAMVFQLSWFLAIPLLANLLGLIFNFNPFMKLARLFLQKNPSAYIPEDVTQQKFNSTIAIICLTLGLIGFLTGFSIIGYLFTIMVALASGIAILGFCIGCFLFFQINQFKHRIKKQAA